MVDAPFAQGGKEALTQQPTQGQNLFVQEPKNHFLVESSQTLQTHFACSCCEKLSDRLPMSFIPGQWPARTREQVMSPSAREVSSALANGTQALTVQADPEVRARADEAAGIVSAGTATLQDTLDGVPITPSLPIPPFEGHEGRGLESYGATQQAFTAGAGQLDVRGSSEASVPQPVVNMASLGMPQLAVAPQEGQPHAAATPDDVFMQLRNVDRVEERSACNPGTSQPPVLRRMTRLTEFLKTTATRGANEVDRVFGDLGISTPTIPTGRTPHSSTTLTSLRQQVVLGGANTQRALEMSPPEELPHDLGVPPSWSQTQASIRPLFQLEDVAHFHQVQGRSSLLLGSPHQDQPGRGQNSEAASTESSAARAEIQRKLEEYHLRQRDEMMKLQQEIFNLRAEKQALEEGRLLGIAGQRPGQLPVVESQPEGPGAAHRQDPQAQLRALANEPGGSGAAQWHDPQAQPRVLANQPEVSGDIHGSDPQAQHQALGVFYKETLSCPTAGSPGPVSGTL